VKKEREKAIAADAALAKEEAEVKKEQEKARAAGDAAPAAKAEAGKAQEAADAEKDKEAAVAEKEQHGSSGAHGAGGTGQVGILSAFQATKGIKFLPFQKVLDFGRIPRSSEGLTVQAAELEEDTFKIFVSHRWLSPWWPGAGFKAPELERRPDGKAEGHPDRTGNPKYELLVAALLRMQADGWIPKDDGKVVIWIDFACIDQDGKNPADELNESMIRLVGLCDMLVTPVVDDEWPVDDEPEEGSIWAGVKSRSDIEGGLGGVADGYKAKGWKEYWKRAWCLLEMLYAANVPFSLELVEKRGFGGELLRFVHDKRVRPHAIFGTRELKLKEAPLLLAPLKDDVLAKKDPRKGELTNKNDYSTIERHVQELLITNLVRMHNIPSAVSDYGHVQVTAVLDKLADVHEKQCEFPHQADLLQMALDIRRRELGDDHVDVAATVDNMGIVLKAQGKFAEALEKHQQALEIRISKLGHDHVDVADTAFNMALVHEKQGDAEEAKRLFLMSADICEKAYGPEHAYTVEAREGAAGC